MSKKSRIPMLKILSFYFLFVFLLNGCAGNIPVQESKIESQTQETIVNSTPIRVGFDIDDTILFSGPAFEKGLLS